MTSLLGATAAVMIAVVGLALGGDGPLPGEGQSAEAQTASPPNIVFVMTDDLDERSMHDLGGIRSLMGSSGATFSNAYVTYSLCCPSRATFLRGQYPHNHQIVGNALPEGGAGKFRSLGLDQSTIATWLNDAGYRTKYIGKYMNSYGGLYKPPGWDEWYAVIGDPTLGRINQDGQEIALSGHPTDVFASKAEDFIRRSSAGPDPFFAVVGTNAPHTPPEVATRHQDAFIATPLPEPPNFDEADVFDKPAWVRAYPRIGPEVSAGMQDLYRERLRSMLSVEDLLERIVATLRETGELESTYVFFTSDNGFHFGNHRMDANKKTPYEEDIGVPLMVRGPGVPAGALRNQLVLNNDFAPTIADLAGVPAPPFVDGRSFAPLLTSSPPSSWRKAFLEEGWFWDGTEVPTPTHKGAHTKGHAFTLYDESAETELYDLAADPYQLASKPRAGNEQLYSSLETRLYNLRDCSAAACRTAEWTSDAAAPRVTGTLPGSNATAVAPTANLVVTFTEDMKASSVNANTFVLLERGTTIKVSASVSYSASTDKATLDPSASLKRGATYEARVSTGVEDLVGNHLDQSTTVGGMQQKAWSFTVSN